MKLSVIVTVYNREKTLERCVESLLAQRWPDYEIILVDDGSTDACPEMIRRYENNHPGKIRGVYQENGGVSSARNAGLRAAGGEVITFVDSDDWVEKNSYDKLMKEMEKKNWDVLFYDAWETYPDGHGIYFPPFYDCLAGTSAGEISRETAILARPCPWNRLIRREIWEKALGENPFPAEIQYEDLATMPALMMKGEKIGYTREPVYFYHQSEASIMRSKLYRPAFLDIFTATRMLRERIGEVYPRETEYLWREHMLLSAGKRFLDCGRTDLSAQAVNTMANVFPSWQNNPYGKAESLSKRIVAHLLGGKHFCLLQTMRTIKAKIK